MNKFFRGVCALGVTIVGLAAGAGIAGTAHAAEEDATWDIYGDGCGYLSDGYASYQAACPRTDGGWDFYVADSGQWSYGFSAFTDAAGCTTVWTDATGVLLSSCQESWQDPTAYVGGGTSGGMLTGNPVIDAILINAKSAIVTTWLSPTCIATVAGVCYT